MKSVNLSQDEIYINPKRKEKEKREIQENIRKEIGDLQRANSWISHKPTILLHPLKLYITFFFEERFFRIKTKMYRD